MHARVVPSCGEDLKFTSRVAFNSSVLRSTVVESSPGGAVERHTGRGTGGTEGRTGGTEGRRASRWGKPELVASAVDSATSKMDSTDDRAGGDIAEPEVRLEERPSTFRVVA